MNPHPFEHEVSFAAPAREQLLDVFRDAAEYWAEKKIPFRVFYSFE